MGDDSDSGDNSSPKMVMEDNSVQLLRDSGSVSISSTTEVAKVGPGVASFHGRISSIIYRSLVKILRI